MLPTAIAPMYAALPRCPMMATSTIPNSGTVMFDMIEGMAMLSISLSRGFIFFISEGKCSLISLTALAVCRAFTVLARFKVRS